jgi:hypothetical protein
VAVTVLCALAGCRESAPEVTGLRVVTVWEALAPEQLVFIFKSGGEKFGDALQRPVVPQGPLTSGVDFVVLLPDAQAGRPIVVEVEGWLNAKAIATGTATADVLMGQLVEVRVNLGGGADAGSHDGPLGVIDRPNGSPCTSNGQCRTTFCVDGVCCDNACSGLCKACNVAGNEGVCGLAPAGNDDSGCPTTPRDACGTDGTCDGLGSCRKHPAGTKCSDGVCASSSITSSSTCDGEGACVAGPVIPCAPFACSADGIPHCNDSCITDADCVMGGSCVNGSCGRRLDGATCKADGDCQSGFCAGGVCCGSRCSDACYSCRQPGSMGVCQEVPAGQRDPQGICKDEMAFSCKSNGRCDGRGACALYPPGPICGAASCSADGTVLSAARRCDGRGTCQALTTVSCSPFLCRNDACTESCSGAGSCDSETTCSGGSCGPKGLAQTCTLDAQCSSGHCVDGVCCDQACQGACRSCVAGPQPGRCSPIVAGGVDPRGKCAANPASSCGSDGTCDGAGNCSRHPAGTICAAGSCNRTSNTRSLPSTCDQAGQCVRGVDAPCGAYACNGSTCFLACGTDADCAMPNVCISGSCGLRAAGNACKVGSECATGNCVDGVCCAASACSACQACNVDGTAGTCAPLPAGVADMHGRCAAEPAVPCGNDGMCDGAGGCRKQAVGTKCGSSRCATDGITVALAPTCDGNGTCAAPVQQSCSPYLCDAGTGACRSSCSPTVACAPPHLCSALTNACGNVKALGVACGKDLDCASGHCTDGVCCTTGPCSSCRKCNVGSRAGTCSPVPAGADDPTRSCTVDGAASCDHNGKCDGNGGCQNYPSGTVCQAGSCSGATANPVRTCNGNGTCQSTSAVNCGAYACNAGTCRTSCSSDSNCTAPNTCITSTCRLKPQGASCSQSNQCATGLSCTNGVCCNSATCGTCKACNVPGFLGFCKEVASGAADPSGTCKDQGGCGTDGRCNGAGGCRRYAAGTICQAANCGTFTFNFADTCDGQGNCVDRGQDSCFPYRCSTGGCLTSCTVDSQCANRCRNSGVCQ